MRSNDVFGHQWAAYARSWERVLAEWDAEKFTTLHPAGPMVFAGLTSSIDWSRKRGEAAQKELIGMTAESEVVSYFSTYGAATSSTAGAATTFETEDT